ncbi:hypothetical protein SO694_00013365 [Aureococcus anophagefferens]|uniref:Kinesin motor domain-containing protein n=1 Tax=Aureococcus anophagefferens TaxID=44056 RepID=A0ABR1G171_AURAN
MEGPPGRRGVYFRALRELFHARPPGASVAVKLSMLEVYNETIVDLLADAASNKPDAVELAKAKQEIRALKAKLAAAAGY